MIGDTSVVERVWRQTSQARVDRIIVATDHKEIADLATSFGAEVMLTSESHLTGTDRVCEVAESLALRGERFDIILNVQGDMPFIDPCAIELVAQDLHQAPSHFGMGTIAAPITEEERFFEESTVKVAVAETGEGLYFSRAPIPFPRDRSNVTATSPLGYHHFGLYAFRPDTLSKIHRLPQATIEKREALEQLRALAHGIRIKVTVVPAAMMAISIEINTPEDLAAANRAVQKA